jgi:hypothetical protein
MSADVEETIARLRTDRGANTDAELARSLGIDQSLISSWRARGRVPKKFSSMVEDAGTSEKAEMPQVWGEIESRAVAIALARYTLIRRDLFESVDIDASMAAFLDIRPLWLFMNRAGIEIRNRMRGLGIDPETAQALILQDDLRNPASTATRVMAELATDLADNPKITNW